MPLGEGRGEKGRTPDPCILIHLDTQEEGRGEEGRTPDLCILIHLDTLEEGARRKRQDT